jgi:hypothetical protein
METYQTKSPILFLIFNRPESSDRVFQRIRTAQPTQLFIGCDGPRQQKQGEKKIVESLRESLLSQVDWDCEVKTLFRDDNLGCGVAVHSAITWFFNNVDQGIILEDDCLPEPGFFKFCDEMLDRYRDDTSIFEISGTNFQSGVTRGDGDYYFSRYGGIWGWATWARAWKHYSFDMSGLDEFINKNTISTIFSNRNQQRYWNAMLPGSREVDTWDYQWLYTIWQNKGICIVPNANLVTNIGFGVAGTHTFGAPHWYSKLIGTRKTLDSLASPSSNNIDERADQYQFDHSIAPGRKTRLKSYLKSILRF